MLVPFPAAGLKREFEVCKLIDTTTCIGCKACEVACLEWNGYSFSETVFNNSYQTMPETAWNYWNLIKFNEHEHADHGMMLLMRKDQCMHCEDPGCLAACPADGAIVQYVNGIVDFQQEHCIGCGYCMTRLPVQHSEVQSGSAQGFQMHAVRGPRQRRARARLHQVVPDWLPALRHEGRHEIPRREAGQATSRPCPDSRMRACTILLASLERMSSMFCTTRRIPNCTAACRRTRTFRGACSSGRIR